MFWQKIQTSCKKHVVSDDVTIRWDDSNKWSNIEFGKEINIIEIKIRTLSGALLKASRLERAIFHNFEIMNTTLIQICSWKLVCLFTDDWPWHTDPGEEQQGGQGLSGTDMFMKVCMCIFRYVRDVTDLDILSQARNNKEVKVSLMLDPKMRSLKDKMSVANLVRHYTRIL